MFDRIRHMLRKEFIQVFRDPRMRGMIFVMPTVQLFIFGYAVTTDVKHIPTAVCDLDNSLAGRELLSRFAGSGYFDVRTHTGDPATAYGLLDTGKVQAILRIDSGFEGLLRSARPAQLQVILDGTDSNAAGIALGYAGQITRQYSQDVLVKKISRLQGAAPNLDVIRLESRPWFNENLESRNFYVPGVIALLVMLITLMLTSMAIVREKEIGTIEQIMVTPITSTEFILGKTVPFAIIGFLDVALITLVAVGWFGVPIRGSLLLLFVATGLYLMTTLGVGLLISTISQTQQQAMMTTFFFTFPAMLLSGFVFPIANMPQWVQYLTYLNPLRYFLVIVRGIFLKGVGLGVLWPQMLMLLVIGRLTLWLATKRFKKTLA